MQGPSLNNCKADNGLWLLSPCMLRGNNIWCDPTLWSWWQHSFQIFIFRLGNLVAQLAHGQSEGDFSVPLVLIRACAHIALVYNTYTLLLSSKLRNDSLPTLCIAENDPRRTRIANAYFSLFMALGNILGYATGAYSGWYRVFPFTVTPSCGVSCANLKSAFLLDIIILVITTYITVASVQEPQSFGGDEAEHPGAEQEAFLWELFGSFRYFTLPVWMVLIVTALTWIGWFPFILFDTDWMGREIYRGSPDNPEQTQSYHDGVRMGSFGLMLNSVLLGFTSVVLEKLCRKWGAGLVWGVSNILMALCFVAMLVITYVAKNLDYPPSGVPPTGIVIASLVVFTILGAPLAVSNRIVFFSSEWYFCLLPAHLYVVHVVYSIYFLVCRSHTVYHMQWLLVVLKIWALAKVFPLWVRIIIMIAFLNFFFSIQPCRSGNGYPKFSYCHTTGNYLYWLMFFVGFGRYYAYLESSTTVNSHRVIGP